MNVKNSSETHRNRAVGMIIGGMVQKDVAKTLEKPLRRYSVGGHDIVEVKI